MNADATQRFSALVEDYERYRPGYPDEAIAWMAREAGLAAGSAVADIGSGTGISTGPLLALGCVVYGVEPNGPMRAAAEARFAQQPEFHSVGGTAEHTTLGDATVDLVLAAQAFHWFDRARTREEFRRILRETGKVALLFNERLTQASPFLQEYEDILLKHSVDYEKVNHANLAPEVFEEFFTNYTRANFPNAQSFDVEGLLGRARSCSYVPHPGDLGYPALQGALEALFDRHQDDGQVTMLYETQVYLGTA